jgi:hypothetical protein
MQQNLEIVFLLLFFALHYYTSVKQMRMLRLLEQKLESMKSDLYDEEKDIQVNLNNRLLRIQQENYARRYTRSR